VRIIKVMRGPGDSITRGECAHGSGGCWGYPPLRDWSDGLPYAVEWVGTQAFQEPSVGALLGLHEGRNGLDLTGAANLLPSLPGADVCLLLLGTNDIAGQTATPATRAAAPANLAYLLDTFPPSVWVVVGTVPAITNHPEGMAWVGEYNTALVAEVHARRTQGKRVLLADTGTAVGSNLADGVHPSGTGYQAMAACWRARLDTLLPVVAAGG
jgi:lysophospholipase L1-like esterase